ncbi:MAG: CHAT domain-containing protein [Armatimonas sp.]
MNPDQLVGQIMQLVQEGEAYFNRREYTQALTCWEAATTLFHPLIETQGKELSSDIHQFYATLLNNTGTAYEELDMLEQALPEYLEAYRVGHAIAPQSFETAIRLSNIGSVYRKQGKLGLALHYHEQASQLLHSLAPLSPEATHQLTRIAAIYSDQDKWQKALESYEAAYRIEQALGSLSLKTVAALNHIGFTCHKLGQLEKAIQAYENAVQALEGIRQTGAEPTSSFYVQYSSAYLGLLILYVDRNAKGDIALAFAALERYKAREFPQPLDLATVQSRVLPESTLLLSYAFAGEKLYRFALRHNHWELFRQPIPETLESDLNTLVSAMFSGESADTSMQRRRLATLLLDGISDSALEGATQVIISPESNLYSLPFELLPWGESVFGEAFAITYTPSATLLDALSKRTPPSHPTASFVGFGDPNSDGPTRERRIGIGAFPAAGAEVREIARIMDGTAFVGVEATPEAVLAHAPHHKYVHFATPGVYDPATALASGLRLNADLVVDLTSATEPDDTGYTIESRSTAWLLAGARNALVALWPVSDRSMCLFLCYFYLELANNPDRPIAESLQISRRAMRTIYPNELHWAPVVLFGLG